MKRSLMRPTAALFPIVLLVAVLLGNHILVANLFVCYCVMQLFTLCSIDAFRNAAAREPGVKRVDKRFGGTFPIVLLGIAVFALIIWLKADKTVFLNEYVWIIASAGSIIIEQLFEERMWALGHRVDGVVMSIISNVLLLTGLLLDASSGIAAPLDINGFYTICGTGLGMIISVFTSYAVEPMRAFSLIPRNVGFFPKAAVQSLLYPAFITVLVYIATWLDESFVESLIDTMGTLEFMFGFLLWRLSRTVCRRAQDESRPLNLLLVTICAVSIVAGAWMPEFQGFIVTWIVLICAAIVFCAPSWRLYVGIVLLLIGIYHRAPIDEVKMIPIVACTVGAVVFNLHKAFLRKV